MLKIGSLAPGFHAPLSNGEIFDLKKHLGSSLVLYFYPKNETAVCTKQACAFRDNYSEIKELNAHIYGISTDTLESHQSFRSNHKLPFDLIIDEEGEIAKLYEAKMLFGFMSARVTYVIDPKGKIRLAYQNELLAGKHLDRVLEVLKEISKE